MSTEDDLRVSSISRKRGKNSDGFLILENSVIIVSDTYEDFLFSDLRA